MARAAMTMSSGGRIAEHLSVGLLARSYPRERIRDILEYEIEGIEDPEPLYCLVTTLHDPREAPTEELAALYPQR